MNDDFTAAERAALEAALPAYTVGAVLGRGAHGVVVAGRHRSLGRAVAIKQLAPHLVGDEAARARFAAEARLLAALDHPHIVPVYDYVADGPLCLLVMEQMLGGSVADRQRAGPFDADLACATVLAACAGLQHAHDHGIVHRDVKPMNLLYTAGSAVKIADFGIAKVVGGSDASVTADGAVLGTPAYLAPEQARGEAIGPPVDVYAAGVVLFELLSDGLPFPADVNTTAAIYRRAHEPARPLSTVAPSVPAEIAAVVDRALASALDDRFATVEEFGIALAGAGSRVWGTEWLQRSGMPAIVSAPLLRAGSGQVAVARPKTKSPTRSTPSAGRVMTDPISPDPISLERAPLGRRRSRGRGRSIAVAAAAVVALVGGGVLLARRDGGTSTGDTTATGPRTTAGTTEITTEITTGETTPSTDGSVPGEAMFSLQRSGAIDAGGNVNAIAGFPLTARIATGGFDGTVTVWDLDTLAAVGDPFDTGSRNAVTAVAVNDDGTQLAAASGDAIWLWDTETHALLVPPIRADSTIMSIAFNDAAQFFFSAPSRVAAAGFDGTIQIWDGATGEAIGTPLAGHVGAVNSVVWSMDGNRLLSGGDDATVREWVVATGLAVGPPLTGLTGAVEAVSYDYTSAFILAAGRDQTVRVWNAATGTLLNDPLQLAGGGLPVSVTRVRLLSNPSSLTRLVVAVSGNGGVTFFDLTNGEVVGEIPSNAGVQDFAFGYGVQPLEEGGPGRVVLVAIDESRNPVVYDL